MEVQRTISYQVALQRGFLFAMVFDHLFRWLHDSVIPRNRVAPDFLQPAPCGYADDFAVWTVLRDST